MRHPTIDDDTLIRKYPEVVEYFRSGGSIRGAKSGLGCGLSAACFVRAAMMRQGWKPEKRRDMTRADRLEKYPEVVFWLRAGKSAEWTARKCGLANSTVLTVRFALEANGENLVKWKRIGWPPNDHKT